MSQQSKRIPRAVMLALLVSMALGAIGAVALPVFVVLDLLPGFNLGVFGTSTAKYQSDTAIKEALNGIGQTVTWTALVDDQVPYNLWDDCNAGDFPADAGFDPDGGPAVNCQETCCGLDEYNAPNELATAAGRKLLRWVYVEHCDEDFPEAPVCVAMGQPGAVTWPGRSQGSHTVSADGVEGTTGSILTSCGTNAAGTYDGKPLMRLGSGVTFMIRPSATPGAGNTPPSALAKATIGLWGRGKTANPVKVCLTGAF
jgi:hypothetical protein